MKRYTVYAELRVSYAIQVDAPDPETAAAEALDEMPGDNLQNVDLAGDWEVLSVCDANGDEWIDS